MASVAAIVLPVVLHGVILLSRLSFQSDIQEELDGAVRNKVVFNEISRKLKEQGHNRDTEQCRNKIKSLKKQYL